MRLRKECEHGRWEEHWWRHFDTDKPTFCPGGEFLPEGALVGNVVAIQDRGLVNGKPFAEPWLVTMCVTSQPEKFTRYVLVALASQVGESE